MKVKYIAPKKMKHAKFSKKKNQTKFYDYEISLCKKFAKYDCQILD